MGDQVDQQPNKLTDTKRQWAREGKFLGSRTAPDVMNRLPPGQHLVRNWPVLDLGQQPEISRASWRLAVGGNVPEPVILDWDAFATLPQSDRRSDIHCVTTWSRYDNDWVGVATIDLIERMNPRADTTAVLLHGSDGYTTNLSLGDFAAPEALLAHAWAGEPLTREHGGPVRLVVPHLYFWKSAKWISEISFLTDETLGFWEVNGYHRRGDPWAEERYS